MSRRKSESGRGTKNIKQFPVSQPQRSTRSGRNAAPSAESNGMHERIALRAYALYEERGSRHGWDLQDWLDAEREILSRTSQS